MLYRIGFNLCIAVSVLLMPWQSTALFLLAGFFIYQNYYEGIVWGAVLDAVFTGGGILGYWYTVYAAIAFVVAAWVKQYLWWYD